MNGEERLCFKKGGWNAEHLQDIYTDDGELFPKPSAKGQRLIPTISVS